MRLIVMGNSALTDGFALLGFETFPNATVETVENVLSELLKNKDKALVFLENNLSYSISPRFRQASSATGIANSPSSPTSGSNLLCARCESAGIIITEIPPLNAPDTYRPAVEDLVIKILGANALDKL